ncbi:adenosylcobinamide-GDP ribazoletransferase [Ornithinimicrobium pekingense]|uniref:Adenosylcobinamide-GDP ribazoletransferase n=1 Tax=Ornithinimicrobium pekingense TaxID=384677 RepID=A0ABQ2FC30_9MICO|nr:adenosylcobinamide-GDP ribazoletransferase [Ornithinimicrobium pekingense]GGK72995.1 adenosylcobinamide-GDP ribazoletransferase [Ornithinimicrobium pekingense]
MGFLDAVTFLTRVPVPAGHRRAVDLARTSTWFPVVGALLGAALLLLASALAGRTSALVAVVVVVALEVVVTGALHLDGLSDVADGLGGSDRATRLRIMKDPATGVYGTAAVALALLLEVALLLAWVPPSAVEGMPWPGPASLLLASSPGWVTAALLGATAWSLSRAAMLPVALALPYARAEGTGRSVVEGLTLRRTLVAWVVPGLLCLALGWRGLAMLVGALAAAAVVGATARRAFGGATGDVLGATAQTALLASLLASTLLP